MSQWPSFEENPGVLTLSLAARAADPQAAPNHGIVSPCSGVTLPTTSPVSSAF